MKKGLILLSFALLSGCADMVMTRQENVTVMYTKEPAADCEEVAILATRCGDVPECIDEFASRAEKAGANVVKIVDWQEYSFGWNKMRMKGAALKCPHARK